MSKRQYLWLFLAGLVMAIGVSWFQPAPNYMDDSYYYAGGLQLATGDGFSEMFLWHYLDDPAGLPHPSHTYWMPLTSILATVGLKLAVWTQGFNAAQVGFILVAALVPPLTAALADALFSQVSLAMLAGWLAVFPGFYLPHYITTDSFGLYMLLGGAFFWLLIRQTRPWQMGWLGLVAGLLHMTRTDGLLWLALGGLAALWLGSAWRWRDKFVAWGALLAGYLLVAAPWLLRNWQSFGAWLPPGNSRALWLREYNELYSYPASLLSFAHWRAAGLPTILSAIWGAAKTNLTSAMVVQGFILLWIVALAGVWVLYQGQHVRRQRVVGLGGLAWLLTFLAMTVVFPFAGARGGFFHSGAAFQPLVWALMAGGLTQLVALWTRKTRLPAAFARRFFAGLMLLMAVGLSLYRFNSKLLGEVAWGDSIVVYQDLEAHLIALGAPLDATVMVNSPPNYYVAAQRPVVVVPNGDPATLFAAAEHYQVSYIMLEAAHPAGLDTLYDDPHSLLGWRYLETYAGTHIFMAEE